MTESNLGKKIKNQKKKISPQTDYFLSQGITYIDYKDTATLRKFITLQEQRIIPQSRSKLIRKNHRRVAIAIKRARKMALLSHSAVEQTEEPQK